MSVIKEPKDIDFIIESEPWTEKELMEFRILMKELKNKSKIKRPVLIPRKSKKHYA